MQRSNPPFCPDLKGSGVIAISVASRDVDAELHRQHPQLEPGPHVALEVADTGEGIAPQDLAKVFERFWRANLARARSGRPRSGSGDVRWAGCSGLGLSVAQSLVEAQGGRIWVESTLGEGTTFRFTLPVAKR